MKRKADLSALHKSFGAVGEAGKKGFGLYQQLGLRGTGTIRTDSLAFHR